jgi:hypothetical protein
MPRLLPGPSLPLSRTFTHTLAQLPLSAAAAASYPCCCRLFSLLMPSAPPALAGARSRPHPQALCPAATYSHGIDIPVATASPPASAVLLSIDAPRSCYQCLRTLPYGREERSRDHRQPATATVPSPRSCSKRFLRHCCMPPCMAPPKPKVQALVSTPLVIKAKELKLFKK